MLSNKLQQLMKIHGNLSISELARLSDVPQPTLHHILSGSTKKPRQKALELLANFFSITTEQLVGESPLPNTIPDSIKDSLKIRTIPIIDWDMIKYWPSLDRREHQLKEIILDNEISQNSFALIMQDSSMEPAFPKGAILIFDFSKKPKDRDLVIVSLAEDNHIIFNRFFIDGNESYIKQELQNGNAQLIKVKTKSDKIIATLAEIRVQF